MNSPNHFETTLLLNYDRERSKLNRASHKKKSKLAFMQNPKIQNRDNVVSDEDTTQVVHYKQKLQCVYAYQLNFAVHRYKH